MNRDKEVYGADADKFLPERFLRKSKEETGSKFVLREEYEVEDGHCSYGFGRRSVLFFLLRQSTSMKLSDAGYV